MKVVLDTNLFIAGFFNKKSASARILELAKEGRVEALWSKATRKETERIVNAVFSNLEGRAFSPRQLKRWQEEVLSIVFERGTEVENPPKVEEIKEDPTDDKFLAVAAEGKADYIVSNDEHLLSVGEFRGIPVATPADFLNAVS